MEILISNERFFIFYFNNKKMFVEIEKSALFYVDGELIGFFY